MLQHVAVWCSVLQCVAACSTALPRVAVCRSVQLSCIESTCGSTQPAMRHTVCSVLRCNVTLCVADCCSVLQFPCLSAFAAVISLLCALCCGTVCCVAVCCSVLQCVAVSLFESTCRSH